MTSTKIVKINPLNVKDDDISEAASILAGGGLVIMPTETVYGIAANREDKEAVERLYAIKERPKDKPFSLHIDAKEDVEYFACGIPISAYKLIDRFWPGPLTLVLKSKDKKTIGLRMPDNEIALEIIRRANVPVVCPSANLSGHPAPVNFREAIDSLQGLVDFAIDAGYTRLRKESSVVDLTKEPLRILREGAIRKEEIEKIAEKKNILFVCTGNSCRSVMAKALLEMRLKGQGRLDVEVSSAGVMMLEGMGATEEVKKLLAREGIDVSGHRAQRVTKDMLMRSDIILVMENAHEEKVLQLAPEVKNRLFLLKEFARIKSNNLEIIDPIGGSLEFYKQTLNVIKEAIEEISRLI